MPATDEVWRLQNDDDPECRLFRHMVRGDEAPSRGTLQGIYVCAPSGVRLGGLNSLDADAVAKMLRTALERWRELPSGQRRLAAGETLARARRWEDSFPADGLVLVRTARDLTDPADPHADRARPINRDQVWFSRDEARRWLPAELHVGAAHAVPQPFVDRLARFHLVDNVRGQTLPFAPSEVAGSALRCAITAREGDLVHARITGATTATADAWLLGDNYWKPRRTWPRGIRTRVLGRATFDLATGKFTTFDMVALGTRRGRTMMNGRRDPAPGALGFALELATGGVRIAPTFINVYDADWVADPRR